MHAPHLYKKYLKDVPCLVFDKTGNVYDVFLLGGNKVVVSM